MTDLLIDCMLRIGSMSFQWKTPVEVQTIKQIPTIFRIFTRSKLITEGKNAPALNWSDTDQNDYLILHFS